MIAKETTDKSIQSQLSIVVRYLKGDTSTERCIGMINQSNLKGKVRIHLAILAKLLKLLRTFRQYKLLAFGQEMSQMMKK